VSRPLTTLIVGTASAPSSSASSTGGSSWSCVHSPLVAVRCSESFTDSQISLQTCDGEHSLTKGERTRIRVSAAADCDWTHSGTNPKLPQTNCYFTNSFLSVSGFRFRIRGAALERLARRPARERGLMRTSLWYSSLYGCARGLWARFCTGGQAQQCVGSYISADSSRAHFWACQYNPAVCSGSRCKVRLRPAAASHSPLSCASIS